MAHRIVAAAAALLTFVASPSRAAEDPSGTWLMRAEGKTASVINIRREGEGWQWDWVRPKGSEIQSSHMVSALDHPAEHRILRSGGTNGETFEFRYSSPSPDEADDVLTFTPLQGGLATISFKGAAFEPILVIRGKPGERLSTAWDANRDYRLDEPWPSNPEMKRLFDEDQAPRMSPATIDWSVLWPQDEARRVATRKLLDAGALHSGDDYWRAAFIFQHGSKPEDFLLAHGLAIIAAAKGRRDASWIAAATLDRYLQTIGQKQIYGTQFKIPPGGSVSQEPYDPTIISDALRTATGVPTLAGQQEQAKGMAARYGKPAAKP